MVEEMYEACSFMRQAITFPVRASLAQRSIPQLQWLMAKSNRFETYSCLTSKTFQIRFLTFMLQHYCVLVTFSTTFSFFIHKFPLHYMRYSL